MDLRAKDAVYDEELGVVMLSLKNGCIFGFPPRLAPELRGAEASDLADVEVEDGGKTLVFDSLGTEVEVPVIVSLALGTGSAARRPLGGEGDRSTPPRGGRAAYGGGRGFEREERPYEDRGPRGRPPARGGPVGRFERGEFGGERPPERGGEGPPRRGPGGPRPGGKGRPPARREEFGEREGAAPRPPARGGKPAGRSSRPPAEGEGRRPGQRTAQRRTDDREGARPGKRPKR